MNFYFISHFNHTDPPQILSVSPSSLVVNQTDNLTFTCVVFGIPTPDIMWSRASSPSLFFTDELDNVEITKSPSGYNITSNITIYDAVRTDMDMYICTGINNITNVINSTESMSVTLFVQGKLPMKWKYQV